jgi:hypothetical protein
MTLEADIIERAREIKTDGYPMSIGEVLSLYREKDLDVHPEFQRIFRWTDEQKWRLIESVLLGIPIPAIFVAQRASGVWDVIDGVQRLSTILQFVGEYRDEEGNLTPPLRLGATEYLPSLDGHVWQSVNLADKQFSEALQRDFKRSKLEFRIVKKESDDNAKFDLFQRLNSGTALSAQESRNCLLVMLNADFYRWMTKISRHPTFLQTVQLSEQKEDEGFREELVLRFFLQSELLDNATQDPLPTELGDHITDWIRGQLARKDLSLDAWEGAFTATFDLLAEAVGEDVFRRFDAEKGRFLGAFSISAFEAITSGVGRHVDGWKQTNDAAARLTDQVKALWSEKFFLSNSGSGFTPRRRTPRLIGFGRAFFRP